MQGLIKLENEIWSLSIAPQGGGSLISCECLGFPVLEPARPAFTSGPDVFASSCFPLIPFSNRLADGKFSFAGKMYQVTPNHPAQKFPIHGNSWEAPWEVISQTPNSCHLSLTYEPKAGGWPWSYQAEQLISIVGEMLTFELSIKNTDKHPFPAGIGLHPFFSNAQSAQIEFDAKAVWEYDEDILPMTLKKITTENGFSNFKSLKGRRLDNCFIGWNGKARIRWPEFDCAIEMRSDSIFSNLVVYTQPENSFFCLEPVSHINNALNLGDAGDVDILSFGEILSGKVIFFGVTKSNYERLKIASSKMGWMAPVPESHPHEYYHNRIRV